jgi:farnesyl-diphosphate farnesyltransferase
VTFASKGCKDPCYRIEARYSEGGSALALSAQSESRFLRAGARRRLQPRPCVAEIRKVPMMNQRDELYMLLEKTSRTFALSIPLLPEPTRSDIAVAYLVFRIVDTLEDATRWSPEQRIEELEEARALIATHDPSRAQATVARWLAHPPLDHEGYLELLAATPRILERLSERSPAARQLIAEHALASASGMARFVERCDGDGVLRLGSGQELQDYCFTVAGIVGNLLTELFLLERPALEPVAAELRARAERFGEGLQLVNILKDAKADAAVGRVFLPPDMPLARVFQLAKADLAAAVEYCELLRQPGVERGLWVFNTLNARLALASVRVLELEGLGAKLSRQLVARLCSQLIESDGGDAALSAAST